MTITSYKYPDMVDILDRAFELHDVSETVQVFDFHLAQLINHLLNHIHILSIVASKYFVSRQDVEIVEPYSHYKFNDGFYDPKEFLDTLKSECSILIDHIIRYRFIDEEGRDIVTLEAERRVLVKSARDQVPFLKFRYRPEDQNKVVVYREED